MVTVKNKQILIDGRPVIIRAGEIHYYRLEKSEWQDRIDKLKAAGMNTVASYIPWLCHEEKRGEFDLDGHNRENLDIIGFIDLCAKNGLYFIARPGPFIMAEMKNEGIPFWVSRTYPETLPVCWDGNPATTGTLDYLNPDFLRCTKDWYAQIMPVLAQRLQTRGGNVIAVQLDNEIGMLSWVSNCPDLTPTVLNDFRDYLLEKYDPALLAVRYPFDLTDMTAFTQAVRSPGEDWVLPLKQDLGYYMRRRFAVYLRTLKEYAREQGVSQVPFLVNIHGTGGGRIYGLPVGISQLFEGYTQSDEFLSGSDIYLNDMGMETFQDLYLINAYMEAVNLADQPTASFEFECGDADYGESLSGRKDPATTDFRTRMCVAQGNKAFNCYLFSGGRNYMLEGENDGNGRIAITGERHGFAAPVGPEGKLNYTYFRLRDVMNLLAANEDKLAVMQEERDNLALAFIPDYYMTEYCYPGSERERKLQRNLEQFRGNDGIERVGRSLLMNHFRFTALDIQNKPLSTDQVQTLVVFTAEYLSEAIQRKLVDFARAGGSLFLYGKMPTMNMEGEPCTVLKDALGIGDVKTYHSAFGFWLSVQPVGILSGSAEVTMGHAETYEIGDCEPLMVTAHSRETTAFVKNLGRGRVLMLGTPYICHLENYRKMLSCLGSEPDLSEDGEYGGIFMTTMKGENNERYLHMLNLDGFDKKVHVTFEDKPLFNGRSMRIASKRALMLPLEMELDGKFLEYATCEIIGRGVDHWKLGLTQEQDVLVFRGTDLIRPSDDYTIREENGVTTVTSRLDARIHDSMTLYFTT
ncbi:MAG: beta-galactosidase [Oscillospiraceae bacterium]|nr:beta-galactosidase [Oscillospiraceae bacterium]MBR2890713.1 beta-galactosidase [Oscillospiraceae bacterium]